MNYGGGDLVQMLIKHLARGGKWRCRGVWLELNDLRCSCRKGFCVTEMKNKSKGNKKLELVGRPVVLN